MNEQRLARGLGWFSVGLGAAELLMPNTLCRALGLGKHGILVRAFGMRELAAGIGILTQGESEARPGWLWARVAGDAVDLGALGLALAGSSKRGRVLGAIASVAGITALDVLCGTALSKGSVRSAEVGAAAAAE